MNQYQRTRNRFGSRINRLSSTIKLRKKFRNKMKHHKSIRIRIKARLLEMTSLCLRLGALLMNHRLGNKHSMRLRRRLIMRLRRLMEPKNWCLKLIQVHFTRCHLCRVVFRCGVLFTNEGLLRHLLPSCLAVNRKFNFSSRTGRLMSRRVLILA